MRRLLLFGLFFGLWLFAVIAPAGAQQRPRNSADWLTPADFPASAKEAQVQIISLNLDISAEGRVVECRDATMRADKTIVAAACRYVAERARYIPAGDANGAPTASKDQLGIIWSPSIAQIGGNDAGGAIAANKGNWVPEDQLIDASVATGSYAMQLRLSIGVDGRVAGCEVAVASANPSIDKRACILIIKNARFVMPLGPHGERLATQGLMIVRYAKLPA